MTDRVYWVLERFEDGKSRGYWDGGSSRSFTYNINKAVQFCRQEDVYWVTRGWHWNDCKPAQHVDVDLHPAAAPVPAREWIPVGERMPGTPDKQTFGDYSDEVLVWVAGFGRNFGRLVRFNSEDVRWAVSAISGDVKVTHWSALPPPPAADK